MLTHSGISSGVNFNTKLRESGLCSDMPFTCRAFRVVIGSHCIRLRQATCKNTFESGKQIYVNMHFNRKQTGTAFKLQSVADRDGSICDQKVGQGGDDLNSH